MLAGLLFEEGGRTEASRKGPGCRPSRRGKRAPRRGGFARPGAINRSLTTAIDLQTRGQKKQALKEFAVAMKAGLDNPAVHYNVGVLLQGTGRPTTRPRNT